MENKKIEKPEVYKRPRCACCGRNGGELRFGWCFDCAQLQSILIDATDMHDNTYSHWTKSEILAHIVRRVMKY